MNVWASLTGILSKIMWDDFHEVGSLKRYNLESSSWDKTALKCSVNSQSKFRLQSPAIESLDNSVTFGGPQFARTTAMQL